MLNSTCSQRKRSKLEHIFAIRNIKSDKNSKHADFYFPISSQETRKSAHSHKEGPASFSRALEKKHGFIRDEGQLVAVETLGPADESGISLWDPYQATLPAASFRHRSKQDKKEKEPSEDFLNPHSNSAGKKRTRFSLKDSRNRILEPEEVDESNNYQKLYLQKKKECGKLIIDKEREMRENRK